VKFLDEAPALSDAEQGAIECIIFPRKMALSCSTP